MPTSIFYSWQSDLPNSTNRGLIERALEQAVKSLRSQELVVDPVIDRDTANVPGSPDIGVAIFDKIDRATAFVADVSIVNAKSKFRPSPNPNVLIELGYALRSLGSQRIILVANTAFGPPDLLPFDLRQKRVLKYCSQPNDESRKVVRDDLAGSLEKAIRPILELSKVSSPNLVDPSTYRLEQDRRFERHQESSLACFPMKDERGLFKLVTVPLSRVKIPEARFEETFLNRSREYSWILNYSNSSPEIHPEGYTRRLTFNKGDDNNVFDGAVVTCYQDGYIITEGYIVRDNAPALRPAWLIYEIQRHLQLSKELLDQLQSEVLLALRLEGIANIGWEIDNYYQVSSRISYAGYHDDIIESVKLSEVHGRDKWNIICEPPKTILRRVARIFGMKDIPQDYWEEDGKLIYAMGGR